MPELHPQNLRHARIVERYASYIDSPVLRLKFLNTALRSDEKKTSLFERVPFLGSLPDRARIILELSKVLPPDRPAPPGIRLTSLMYRLRYGVFALSLAVAVLAGTGLVYAVAKIAASFSVSTEAKDLPATQQAALSVNGSDAVSSIASGAGITLDKVWLAEKGEGFEFYSNGARVLTEFQTSGAKRTFYRFQLDSAGDGLTASETLARPVGIVYHVSESDLLPFADRYNSSLQYQSRALIEYARTHRLYNYVIDRFGRIYRIVADECEANHAGNSTWSDGHSVWVDLSASFIGVCFEGRGAAMGADGINEAQVYAARVLTAVLRSKYAIEDANCVTHGLVSVNPSNHLMGYHTDWVAEFPFEALGLSNKYNTELIAISRLGFAYDQAYITAAGGKWSGLETAEAKLSESAAREGRTIEEERRVMSRSFSRAYSLERALAREGAPAVHSD